MGLLRLVHRAFGRLFRCGRIAHRQQDLLEARSRNVKAHRSLRSALADLVELRGGGGMGIKAYLRRAFGGEPDRQLPPDLRKMLKRLQEQEQEQKHKK